MRAKALLGAWLLAAAAGCGAQSVEPLRVCADPDNLPYSREDGSGFENRIASLVAEELGRPLLYAWLPDRRGFVRKTLNSGVCDLIVGVPAEFERTLNTRPYYRSSYVLVAPGAAPRDFSDPRLAQWRIGVQLVGDDLATSPPAHALARTGKVDNVVGFPIPGEQPAAERIVAALARHELDAAFLWGVQAGWYVHRAHLPLALHRLAPPPELKEQPFEFAIAMGVRRSDRALRDQLDAVLDKRRADIRQILADYHVPVLPEETP